MRKLVHAKLRYTALVFSALSTIFLSESVVAVSQQPSSLESPFQTYSLERLIADADLAFVGVAQQTLKVERSVGKLPAHVTSFLLKVVLKDGPKNKVHPGQEITVRQFAHHRIATADAETVLWYLKAKGSLQNSFSSPVGRFAGDFRRVEVKASDEAVSTLMVQNQLGNRGLWSNQEGGKLWNNTTFKRSVAEDYLDKYLQEEFPTLKASDPKGFEDRVKRILDVGEYPCKPKPIPLELLLAATHARLSAN